MSSQIRPLIAAPVDRIVNPVVVMWRDYQVENRNTVGSHLLCIEYHNRDHPNNINSKTTHKVNPKTLNETTSSPIIPNPKSPKFIKPQSPSRSQLKHPPNSYWRTSLPPFPKPNKVNSAAASTTTHDLPSFIKNTHQKCRFNTNIKLITTAI